MDSSLVLNCDKLSPALIGSGGILVVLSLSWILVAFLRSRTAGGGASPAVSERLPLLWLAAILLIGAALRFYDYDADSLTHPEAYIPGIELPADISEPPPRLTFIDAAIWHFHDEPHPFGYYLAMMGWTELFGTTVTSMRLPAVLLGILSILLVYAVAAQSYGRNVALIAAALLALHGFHIYWSQSARMYVPGAFLGLAATWLMVSIHRSGRDKLFREAGYVAVILAGVLTVEFFWVLLCFHILWGLVNQPPDAEHPSRLAYLQTLAFILGAPMLLHAAYNGRQGAVPDPELQFLIDYFAFGFVYMRDVFSIPARGLPGWLEIGVLCGAVAFCALGLTAGKRSAPESAPRRSALPWLALVPGAIGIATIMSGLACAAYSRHYIIYFSIVPIIALAIPAVVMLGGRIVAAGHARATARPLALASPVPLLGLVAPLLPFAASFFASVAAPRAFLIFVPYLLIVAAAGIASFCRTPLRTVPVAAATALLFVASAVHFIRVPAARDYKALAAEINARIEPGDVIFVRHRHWRETPVFYYLENDRLVAADYSAALAADPSRRAWVILFDDNEPTPEMASALTGYDVVMEVEARRSRAHLYAPRGKRRNDGRRMRQVARAGQAVVSFLSGPLRLVRNAAIMVLMCILVFALIEGLASTAPPRLRPGVQCGDSPAKTPRQARPGTRLDQYSGRRNQRHVRAG